MSGIVFSVLWSVTTARVLGQLKWMSPVADERADELATDAEIDDLIAYVYEQMRQLCVRCHSTTSNDWETEYCALCTTLDAHTQTDWSLTYRMWLKQLPSERTTMVTQFARNRFFVQEEMEEAEEEAEDASPPSGTGRLRRALIIVGLVMAQEYTKQSHELFTSKRARAQAPHDASVTASHRSRAASGDAHVPRRRHGF